MLTAYHSVDGVLVKCAADAPLDDKVVWVDLINPSKDEDALVEKALAVTIPTREEMAEIEASSRLYMEGGAHYMTAVVLHQVDMPGIPERGLSGVNTVVPQSTPVTFVLSGHRLVTVRYSEPRAFPIFLSRNCKGDMPCPSGVGVLVGLLESIIDREADRVERLQSDVDVLGHAIFDIRGGQRSKNRRYDLAVKQIGREAEMTSRSRESLQSLARLTTYVGFVMGERGDDKQLRAHIRTASRDVDSLNDQVNYLSNKVQFLLDATLGMINLEQNNIIKFFTVVSVALMPPTLVASIYGMNFKRMPELEWAWGYPMAIVLMLISAIVPFVWFKRKGWL
jgi:magnesium transporter